MFDLNQQIRQVADSRGWKAIPLKYVYRRKKELGDGSEELLSIYRDYGVVPKNSRSDNFNKPSEDLSKYQRVQSGDIVINKMKAWQGSVAVSDYSGIISPAYFVYEPQMKVHPRYIHYLIRSEMYFNYYASISSGVRPNQWDLDPVLFERINLLLPPLDEQKRIADELDRELAEIDRLITDQLKLKELLKEQFETQKEQIILETGGQEVRLSRVLKGIKDGTHGTHPRVTSGGEVLLSAKNISSGELVISEEESRISAEEAAQITASGFPQKGDVMMILVGATYGRTSLYNLEQTLPFQRSVGFFRPNEKLITSEYLQLAMSSYKFQQQLSLGIKTSAQPGIYLSDVSSCRINLPNKEKQILAIKNINQLKEKKMEIFTNIEKSIQHLFELKNGLTVNSLHN